MDGHQHDDGMQHSEDALRRAREARENPSASRRDHAGRMGLFRRFLWVLGVVAIGWMLWSNLLA